jgi:PleD family two-component response regulator
MNQLQNNDQSKGEILVVDDNINNLNLLSDILNVEGYKVRRAINGQMALMRVKKSPIYLILLDINMPEINGYKLCEQLKSNPESHNIPVIFLSALNDTLDKVKAFSVGRVDSIRFGLSS